MSCSSIPVSSAAVSLACQGELLTKAEIQSIFHTLKNEGEKELTPLRKEYEEELEHLLLIANNHPGLSDKRRASIVARLNEAFTLPIPDGPTWFATKNILSSSAIATTNLEQLFIKMANGLPSGYTPAFFRDLFETYSKNHKNISENIRIPEADYSYHIAKGIPKDKVTVKVLKAMGYTAYLAQPHPIFIYGDMREGNRKYKIIEESISKSQSASINEDSLLYSLLYSSSFGEDKDKTIEGELVYLDSEKSQIAHLRLDRIQKFDLLKYSSNETERILTYVPIEVERNGIISKDNVPAWVYRANPNYNSKVKESKSFKSYKDNYASSEPLFVESEIIEAEGDIVHIGDKTFTSKNFGSRANWGDTPASSLTINHTGWGYRPPPYVPPAPKVNREAFTLKEITKDILSSDSIMGDEAE
jgi:gamma-glutamylcyclotransferase (GGCT)/AIG2-like uncharacterized protein YtfP